RHTRFSRDWSSDVCSSDLDVLAARPVLVGAPAVLPVAGLVPARVAVVDQRVDVAVGDGEHAAAAPAVAPVGTALRNELLAPERQIGRASCREREYALQPRG